MTAHTWKDWYGSVHTEPYLEYYDNLSPKDIEKILLDRLDAVGAIKHQCLFVNPKGYYRGYYGLNKDTMVSPTGDSLPNRLDAYVKYECQKEDPSYWQLSQAVGID